ncbi:hypothetical protein ACTWQF_25530 [Streptomyces sp. 8N114]|uniref:hypothetical protein n=1 Tax=Streptomyces sp. 8N114 TaxID=3457419 RepID=UPI003FD29878
MTNGDLRYGRCGACGGEVYRGEYVAQGGLRPTGAGAFGTKQTVFDAFVCAACGNVQLHVRLDAKMSSHIRNKLTWIPPQQGMG